MNARRRDPCRVTPTRPLRMKQSMSNTTPFRTLALSVLYLALTSPAIANDSTARIGAGGLVFLKNDDIRMASEALSVSANRINVRYRFRNETATAIDAVVAFPMPAFRWNPGVSAWDSNVGPIESFAVTVDGRAVVTQVEQKALLDKRGVTANLRNAGLTDTQIIRSFGDMMDWRPRLPTAVAKKLNELSAMKDNWPQWDIAETAYWRQIFPGNSDLAVEHNYKPLSGRSYNIFIADSDLAAPERLPVGTTEEDQRREDRACLDKGARSAVIKRMTALFKQEAKRCA